VSGTSPENDEPSSPASSKGGRGDFRSADRWLVVTVSTPSPDLRELIASELVQLTGAPALEQDDRVTAYLRAAGDPEEALNSVRQHLADALPLVPRLDLAWGWQDDDDWDREWKRGLRPRVVSERIVVKPTWTEFSPAPGQIVLDIDPQMAFGTGEHATTRGCLRLLDGAVRAGDRALDVGSGSAILAIAAALLGASGVVAVEYDPDANLNARENLEHHRVQDRVTILEQTADAALLAELGRFDLVTANILSGVIRPLLPAFRRSLENSADARLIVSGILQSEADEVLAAAGQAGFQLSLEDREDEWWSALLVPVD
jgi:ribosomal protein L11 methyltransferase